jgi:GAF domain-containing protein
MKNNAKANRYKRIIEQLKELLDNNNGQIAHMATINAILYHKINTIFWCGFYLLKNNELIVGPYQGPVACQKLQKNTGVCWAGINQQKSIVVPDVEKFPGHIACDSRSRSEVVVPVKNQDRIIGVLDIDSKDLGAFDETDRNYLEKIVALINQ